MVKSLLVKQDLKPRVNQLFQWLDIDDAALLLRTVRLATLLHNVSFLWLGSLNWFNVVNRAICQFIKPFNRHFASIQSNNYRKSFIIYCILPKYKTFTYQARHIVDVQVHGQVSSSLTSTDSARQLALLIWL